jgi:uncharacterized protein (DUF58 family)
MRKRRKPRRTRTVLVVGAGLFFVLFFPSFAVQWIGYLILAIVLGSYAYSRSTAENLEITRPRGRIMTYRGQPAAVELVVKNRGYLRIPYVSIIDTTGGLYSGDQERRIVTLRPRETIRLRYTAKGVNRGAYRLGPIRVRLSDPLGLYPRQFEVRELAEVVIYPQVHPVSLIDDRGLPAGTLRLSNPVYEDATRYRSVREYVAGDDPRKISWKVSARMGTLHSLEFLPTMYAPTIVFLNLTASHYQRRHRFQHTERAIEAAASLAYYTIGKGQAVGLISSGVLRGSHDQPVLPMRSGLEHGAEILGTLARITADESGDNPLSVLFERGEIPFGTRLQYVGPRVSDEELSYLTKTAHGGSYVELFTVQERVHGDTPPRDLKSIREYHVREYGEAIIVREL